MNRIKLQYVKKNFPKFVCSITLIHIKIHTPDHNMLNNKNFLAPKISCSPKYFIF